MSVLDEAIAGQTEQVVLGAAPAQVEDRAILNLHRLQEGEPKMLTLSGEPSTAREKLKTKPTPTPRLKTFPRGLSKRNVVA